LLVFTEQRVILNARLAAVHPHHAHLVELDYS
jgi:hypothetical protein